VLFSPEIPVALPLLPVLPSGSAVEFVTLLRREILPRIRAPDPGDHGLRAPPPR